MVELSCIKTGCQYFQFLRSAIAPKTFPVEAWITTDLTVMTFEGISKENKVTTMNKPSIARINPFIDLISFPFKHFDGNYINCNTPNGKDTNFRSYVPKILPFEGNSSHGSIQMR